MATRRISGLILQKSSVSARWLCTVKETTETVKEKKNLMFSRVSRLTPFSKTSANDVLDKWVEEGNLVKRFDLVNLISYYRNRKKFYIALQLCYYEKIDVVEEVVEKMKSNNVELSLFTYGNLATIYVDRGLFGKANHFLEMMEKMDNKVNKFGAGASRTRMKLFSEMNDLSGVKRAWESLKSTYGERPSNTSYLSMLVVLSKLGDQESLENLFREWEMDCYHYDCRLPNVLLKFYLRRDMIEEATTLYENLVSKGMERHLSTVIYFATLCIKKGQIDLALKYLATGVDRAKYKEKKFLIPEETIKLFLDYFEENCDEDRAEKFVDCMRKIDGANNRLKSSVSDSLLLKIRAFNRSTDN